MIVQCNAMQCGVIYSGNKHCRRVQKTKLQLGLERCITLCNTENVVQWNKEQFFAEQCSTLLWRALEYITVDFSTVQSSRVE